VNWREEAPTQSWESEESGEIMYEGMVSDLLSGVLQTHQAIIGEDSELLSWQKEVAKSIG